MMNIIIVYIFRCYGDLKSLWLIERGFNRFFYYDVIRMLLLNLMIFDNEKK